MNYPIHWYIFATQKYLTLANRCKNSFNKYRLPVEIIQYNPSKDWMKTCMLRSTLLLERASTDYAVGMFDADIECLKNPLELFTIDSSYDILICDRLQEPTDKRFNAGLITFNSTDTGLQCLQTWSKLCQQDQEIGPYSREQFYLYRAILIENHLKIKRLPDTYNEIPGSRERTRIVVMHDIYTKWTR